MLRLVVDLHDHTADHLSVRHDVEGLRRRCIQRLQNILTLNDFFILRDIFSILRPGLSNGPDPKCELVHFDERLPLITLQSA